MAEVNVDQYLEIKVYTHLDGQLGINVHFGKIVELGGEGMADTALVNAISTWLAPVIKPLISSEALYCGVSVRQWQPTAPRWATLWSKTAQGVGTAGATPCPKQATGIFTKNTSLAGQAYRGRCYVPFPATTSVEPEGNPTAAYLTALGNYCARVDGAENVDVDFGLVIAFGLFRWRQASSWIRTTQCLPRDRFATQRRRGDYGRVNAIPAQLA